MATSKKLALAILAMDSYNRGYAAGLDNSSSSLIGATKVLVDSSDENFFPAGTDKAEGFYAVAYKVSGTGTDLDGKTVISYRGTDNFKDDPVKGGSDVLNGWLAGAGKQTTQVDLARAFYENVTGQSIFAGPAANVVVTGHSLGGGLAEIVSLVSGTEGFGFDHMPGAVAAAAMATGGDVSKLHLDNFQARSVKDEILQDLRSGKIQGIIASLGSLAITRPILSLVAKYLGIPLDENAPDQALMTVAEQTAASEQKLSDPSPLDSDAGLTKLADRGGKLHMQDLLVLLQFAQDNAAATGGASFTAWRDAGQQIWEAYFDDHVATAVGADTVDGEGTPTAKMGRMIAYSAIDKAADPAGKPFGDTAAWSFFSDADDLGKALSGTPAAFFDKHVTTHLSPLPVVGGPAIVPSFVDVKQAIADMAVQYAGALAKNKVTEGVDGRVTTPNGPVYVRDGVLALSKDGDVLSVDVSGTLWKDALGLDTKLEPMDLSDFRKAFIGQAADSVQIINSKFLNWLVGSHSIDDASLQYIAKLGWSATTADIFDRFDIATKDQDGDFKIPERSYDRTVLRGDKAQVDVYIGSAHDERITGTSGDDLILGGSSTDTIDGGAGDDVVVAGSGANSVTIGGLGRDVVVNFSQGGKVWGDTKNGVDPATNEEVADTEANADIFWWAPGVEIMDARTHDRLLFQGLALTGGSRNPAYLSAATSLPYGVGSTLAAATIANSAEDSGLYFDKLLPFITYKMDGKDLLIGNVFDGLYRLATGQSGVYSSGQGGAETDDLRGVMRVKDFHLEHSIWGVDQDELAAKGTLGMAFARAGRRQRTSRRTGPRWLSAHRSIARRSRAANKTRMS